jgi:hypothetical protein
MNKIQAELRLATPPFTKHMVIVREYKFDSIRQESYWVTREVRQYRLRSDAEAYASRYTPFDINSIFDKEVV